MARTLSPFVALAVVVVIGCARSPVTTDDPPVETSGAVFVEPEPAVDPEPGDPEEPRYTVEFHKPLGLTDGAEIEFSDIVIESIEPPPGSDEPGGETTAQLVFRIDVGEHRESVEVWVSTTATNPSGLPASGWGEHARVTIHELDASNPPAVVASASRYGEAGEPRALRLEVDQRALLDEAAPVEVELRGHGHKTVKSGGSSPLMIALYYYVPERAGPESQDLSLHEPMRWRWRNYAFAVDSYEYDVSMDLSVSEHPLVPLGPR